MKPKDLLALRLCNHQLVSGQFATVESLVNWMGAMQAQDYAMAKWALSLRLKNSTEPGIESAINEGKIFRVHILRPTWHFVAAQDLRWMMALTAAHVKKAMASQNRKIGLDDTVIKKCYRHIEALLADGVARTREEIVEALRKKRLPLDALQATNVMIFAELDRLVCNGPRSGKKFTYNLFEQRVPPDKELLRTEALAKLAFQYFTSHGPATLQDFVWWSGLPVKDAKVGVEENRRALTSFTLHNQSYWYNADTRRDKPVRDMALLFLPPYDEFTVGYSNREFIGRGTGADKDELGYLIFKPLILHQGKAIGTWKREVGKDLLMDVALLARPSADLKRNIQRAATRHLKYLDVPSMSIRLGIDHVLARA